MKNYRYQTSSEDIELHLQKYSLPQDFYHDMIEPCLSYVHYFNLEKGKKAFENLKFKTSQYQECYETIYDKSKTDSSFDKIYTYLKNQDYLEYVYNNLIDEDKLNDDNKDKQEEVDEEGFIKVSGKKKGK